jgi:imidazole glycerol-phosphate synthase
MHFLLVFIGVTVVKLRVAEGEKGPNGEEYCWWQVTVKGGRETRNMDAITLARVS